MLRKYASGLETKLPGRLSAGFKPESFKIGLPAGRLPAGGSISRFSRIRPKPSPEARFPTRKHYCVTLATIIAGTLALEATVQRTAMRGRMGRGKNPVPRTQLINARNAVVPLSEGVPRVGQGSRVSAAVVCFPFVASGFCWIVGRFQGLCCRTLLSRIMIGLVRINRCTSWSALSVTGLVVHPCLSQTGLHPWGAAPPQTSPRDGGLFKTSETLWFGRRSQVLPPFRSGPASSQIGPRRAAIGLQGPGNIC
jgi:hypothetical protein